MQIIDNGSKKSLGQHGYCGQYYKEKVHYVSISNNITIFVKGFEGVQKKNDWNLSVRYKFIPKLVLETDTNDGVVSNDSNCEYYFDNCDATKCVVRSPNFPAMYPRNMSCTYYIKQTRIPWGKHALIQLSQHNPYKMMIRYRSYHWPVTVDNEPKLWTDCDADIIKVHDGSTVSDPIIAQFCDSGPLEPIVSRGSRLTIAFQSLHFA